jgi:uncharacterized protein YjiK
MRWIIFVGILSALFGRFAAADKTKSLPITALRITESFTLPAVEISGLAWRKNPETKRRELVVVGDRDHKIHIIDWENRNPFRSREIDLKPLEAKEGSESAQSEWESVFSDESGRLFIVQERPSQVVIVSADLSKIEGRITLGLSSLAKSDATSSENSNSGGEGLVPLKNGHILVVHEKNPLQIIEYAPAGEPAQGYHSDLAIEKKGRFPLPSPSSSAFVAAHTWRLSAEREALFEDSSGLNSDDDGALYLLGDQKNLIGHIGRKLKTDKAKVKIDRLWSLPSSIRQPEGMVIDEEGRPIIAVDRKNAKHPNLFLLSPLKK